MPFLIITAGPTGAGKAKIADETFMYLIGRIPAYQSFLVDDLVEGDPEYKKEVDYIIERFKCDEKSIYIRGELCYLERPSEYLLNAFKEAYFKIRKKPGCNKNSKHLNCDALNDENIHKAIALKSHIVIETTGSYLPGWIMDLEGIENYSIVFSYSIVTFETLLLRNSQRATKSMSKYLIDKTTTAPRLIDIREETFRPIVFAIYKTLLELRNICLLSVDERCFSQKSNIDNSKIHNLLVFDNSGTFLKMIYDHQKHAFKNSLEFQKLIYNAFFD